MKLNNMIKIYFIYIYFFKCGYLEISEFKLHMACIIFL